MRKKFTMLLAALLCCVGVVKAQITSLSELSNDKVYTLKSGRSSDAQAHYLLYHTDASDNLSSTYGSGHSMTYSDNTKNFHFAIYKSSDKYYFFSVVAEKFIGNNDINNGAIPLVEIPTNDIEIRTSGNTSYNFVLSTNGTGALNAAETTGCHGVVNWAGGYSNLTDAGNIYMISEVGDLDVQLKSLIEERINAATVLDPARAAVNSASNILVGAYTLDAVADLSAALTDYDNENTTANFEAVKSEYETLMANGAKVTLAAGEQFTVKCVDDSRGYMVYSIVEGKGSESTAYLAGTSYADYHAEIDVEGIYKEWTIVAHNGKNYMYNVTNMKFINSETPVKFTDTPCAFNFISIENNLWEIQFEDNNKYLSFSPGWNENAVRAEGSIDDGCKFYIEKTGVSVSEDVVSIVEASFVNEWKQNTLATLDYVGGYPTSLREEINAVSTLAGTTAFDNENESSRVAFTPGYYFIKSTSNDNYATYNSNTFVYSALVDGEKLSAKHVMEFVQDGENMKLQVPNLGKSVVLADAATNSSGPSPIESEIANGSNFTIDNQGYAKLIVKGDNQVMRTENSGAINYWWGDTKVTWYLIPVTELEMTITEFASICLPFDVVPGEGVKAYAVTAVENDKATLVEKADIPAGEGAILKGNGTVKLKLGEATSDWTDNLLEGTTVNMDAPDNAYILSAISEMSGTLSEASTITANQAYIKYEAQIDDVKYLSLADAIAAVSAATSNPTITLLADITATETIVFDNTVTLNLNGFTVKNTTEKIWAIKVDGNSTLTLTDNTEGAQGTIKAWKGVSVVQGSNLVMNGGNIVTTGATGAAIQVFGSEATMNGGNIKSAYGAILMYSKGDVRGTFTMNDGTINSVSPAIYANGSEEWDDVDVTISGGKIVSETVGVYWPAVGKLTIAGGEIEGKTAVYVKGGSLEITDGTLTGIGEKAEYGFVNSGFNETGDALVIENVASGGYQAVSSVVISGGTFKSTYADAVASYAADGATAVANFIKGGTFSSAVAKEYCAAGFIPTENEDGTCGVKEGVACVEGVGYETLQEAYDAVADGDTITLNADATGAGLVIKKNVTIDFNDKTYTVNSAVGSTGTETLAFQVLAGANAAAYDVTFKNGTIKVVDKDAVVEESKALKVVIMNYSNLTLDGMTVDGTGSSVMQYGVATNNGKLTLAGETAITVSDDVCALDVDGSQKYYGAVTAEIGENVTINGDVAIYGENATVAITQGTFSGDFSIDETAGVTITGGAFANDTDEDVLLHLTLGYQLQGSDGAGFTAAYTGKSDLVRIVDGAGAYENTADVPVGELRYVRTFGHTDWQVLYVPFEIPVENMNGIEVYSISSVADDVVMVDKVTSGTLAAHTPYLIKANEVGEKTITVENDTLKAVPETAGKIELGNGYTFTGTYAPMDATALSGSYVLTGVMENEVVTSAQWMLLDAGSTAVLGAFRVYLEVSATEAGAPSLRIATRGETGTTSIDNAQLTNDNEAVIYDLTGRRVEKMEKGIYIVNGKKVVIR